MIKLKLFFVLIAVLMLFILAAPVSALYLDANTCSGPDWNWWEYNTWKYCTVSGAVTISSDITLTTGTELTVLSTGSITISSGTTITNPAGGGIHNKGTINNAGGTINNGGLLRDYAGGLIRNYAGGTILNYNVIYNEGIIRNDAGGTINNAYEIHNCGGTIYGVISGNPPVVTDCINSPGGDTTVPEFPTMALPVIAVICLMFLFQRKKGK